MREFDLIEREVASGWLAAEGLAVPPSTTESVKKTGRRKAPVGA